MDFRAFYESPWQQPILTGGIGFVCGGAAALAALRARPSSPRGALLTRWTLAFALSTLLDCYLTGASSPLGTGGPLATLAAVVFVVLGDLRPYLLLAGFTRPAWTRAALVEALAWSFAPSLFIALVKRAAPWLVPDLRHIFLVYEGFALVLLGVWHFAIAPRRAVDPAMRGWLRGVLGFFAMTYVLWIAADLAILAEVPSGWGLRVVPNALYYGLFVAWAWRTAPRELRA